MRRKRPYTEPDRIKERIRVIYTKRWLSDRVDYCSMCGSEHPITASGLSDCCDTFMVTTNRDTFERGVIL